MAVVKEKMQNLFEEFTSFMEHNTRGEEVYSHYEYYKK